MVDCSKEDIGSLNADSEFLKILSECGMTSTVTVNINKMFRMYACI